MYIELEDIEAIKSSWPILEKLYVTCQKEMPIKLKFQEVSLQDLDSFGEVKMICLDPKNIQTPVEMKHISWFQINKSSEFLEERKIELKTKLQEIVNLEILSNSPWDFDDFNMDWFSSLGLEKVNWIELFGYGYMDPQERDLNHLEIKRLKKKKSKSISISHFFEDSYYESWKFEKMLKNIPEFQLILQKSAFCIDINQFLGILNAMSKIKNLIIDGNESAEGFLIVYHEHGNRLNEKDTEKCFQNAMEIIGKFPRENKFEIREMDYGFAIKKTKGNPPELTRIFEDEDGQVI